MVFVCQWFVVDAAEELYKKALELGPADAYCFWKYANFLAYHRQDYDDADAMYKKAIALDPSDADITVSYAEFLKGCCASDRSVPAWPVFPS